MKGGRWGACWLLAGMVWCCTATVARAQVDSDTIDVRGGTAIIFRLSQEEADSLDRAGEQGVGETVTDFLVVSGRLRQMLDSADVTVLTVTAPEVVVMRGDTLSPFVFERQGAGDAVDWILVNGDQKPCVLSGVFRDDVLRELMAAYFEEE